MKPGAVEPRRARTSVHVRDPEVLHRDPDDAAVLAAGGAAGSAARRRRRRRGLGGGARSGISGCGAASLRARLRCELGLAPLLGRLDRGDLGLDRREHAAAARRACSRSTPCARPARRRAAPAGHGRGCSRARARRMSARNLVTSVRTVGVLFGDPRHRLQAVEEIFEAAGPDEHVERRIALDRSCRSRPSARRGPSGRCSRFSARDPEVHAVLVQVAPDRRRAARWPGCRRPRRARASRRGPGSARARTRAWACLDDTLAGSAVAPPATARAAKNEALTIAS